MPFGARAHVEPANEASVRLFTIHRSTNANVVCYDARLTSANEIATEDPIDAYWLMFAEKGQREELSWFERTRAYGFDLNGEVRPSSLTMDLQAFPYRPVGVEISGGSAIATIAILGKPAILHDVFVKASGGFIPSVDSIELRGTDRQSGEAVVETIRP